ncbi:tetratricopeptide repeat protein [candidate division KSB1 bacterium]|nr:tetratricopeptide repeat protein [candidate division KSB1 bacterium]
MKYKIAAIALGLLMLNSCAWHRKQAKEQIRLPDSIDMLFSAVDESETFGDADSLIATVDSLCSAPIIVSGALHLDSIQGKIDLMLNVDSEDVANTTPAQHQRLTVSLNEFKFRSLVNAQVRMKQAFQQEEQYSGCRFDKQISNMLPYIQANKRYGKIKCDLLLRTIRNLDSLQAPDARKRAWLAIDRMLDEIDLQKSEVEYEPFQRSPRGIFTTKGELLAALKQQRENEKDTAISQQADEIISRIGKQLSEQVDSAFIDEVEFVKEANRRFRFELAKSDTLSYPEAVSNATKNQADRTAADWFHEGYHARDDKQKIQCYSRAIELDRRYIAAYNNRGNAYMNLGLLQLALADFNQTVKLDPQFALAYINRGNAFKQLKMYPDALQDYCSAIKLAPFVSAAYLNRGNVYQNLGKNQAAIHDFEKTIQLEPESYLAYHYRGISYANLDLFEEALSDFSEVIRREPSFAPAYQHRGNAFRGMGNDSLAIRDYLHAIELDSTYAAAYNNLGISHKNLHQYDKAITAHRKALEISPDYTAAYYNLGCVYWALRQWNEVIRTWEKCLEIDPLHENARKWLKKARREASDSR